MKNIQVIKCYLLIGHLDRRNLEFLFHHEKHYEWTTKREIHIRKSKVIEKKEKFFITFET